MQNGDTSNWRSGQVTVAINNAENLTKIVNGITKDTSSPTALKLAEMIKSAAQKGNAIQPVAIARLSELAKNNNSSVMGETVPVGSKMLIQSFDNGNVYVKADRQVVSGSDPIQWSRDIENYINDEIRKGEDISLKTADGNELILSIESAYKLSDPHKSKIEKENRELMSEDEYRLKAGVVSHIDELIQVAQRKTGDKGHKDDVGGTHKGKIGEDGFNYYNAFFEDFDGTYYQVTISAGIKGGQEYGYSTAEPQKRRKPTDRTGSSSVAGGALNGSRLSPGNSIYQNGRKSQEKLSGKSEAWNSGYMQEVFERALAKKQGEEKPANMNPANTWESGVQSGASLEAIMSAERLSNATGREMVFFSEAASNGAIREGFYNPADGRIYLNALSQNPMAQAVAHELTHSTELSETYNQLRDMIMGRIAPDQQTREQLIQNKTDFYAKHGVELTEAEAEQELVAEYIAEHLLTDEKRILNLTKKNGRIANGVLNWVDKILGRLENDATSERAFLHGVRKLYVTALQQSEGLTDASKQGIMENSFAGIKAKIANIKTLREAKSQIRKGESKELVFFETGWFLGKDGKWRFEINDRNAKVKKLPSVTEMLPLSEVLNHRALYKAYPRAGRLKVCLIEFSNPKTLGSFSGNVIYLSKRHFGDSTQLNTEMLTDTLLHEVQHWIQGYEGFEKGINPTTALDILRERAEEWLMLQKDAGYIEASKNSSAEAQNYVDEFIKRQYGNKSLEEIADITYERFHGEREAFLTESRSNLKKGMRRRMYPDYGEELMFRDQKDLSVYAWGNQSPSLPNATETQNTTGTKGNHLVLQDGEVKNLLSPVDNRPQQNKGSKKLQLPFVKSMKWEQANASDPHDLEVVKELLQDEELPFTGVDYSFAEGVSPKMNGRLFKTLAQNLDSAAGSNRTLRQKLYDVFERPLYQAKDSYSREVVNRVNAFGEKMRELGIKKGSKESAAVQWYGEGQRQVEYEGTIKKNTSRTALCSFCLFNRFYIGGGECSRPGFILTEQGVYIICTALQI